MEIILWQNNYRYSTYKNMKRSVSQSGNCERLTEELRFRLRAGKGIRDNQKKRKYTAF